MNLRKPLLHNDYSVDIGFGESGLPVSERPKEEVDDYGVANYQMLGNEEDDNVIKPNPAASQPLPNPNPQQYTYQPYQPSIDVPRPSTVNTSSSGVYPGVYKPGVSSNVSAVPASYSSVYGQYPAVNKPAIAGVPNRAATVAPYPAFATPVKPLEQKGVEDVDVYLVAPDLPYNVPVHAAPSAMSRIVEYVKPGDMFVGSANVTLSSSLDSTAPAGGGQVGDMYIVRAISLKVRSSPSLQGNLLTTIKMNTQVAAKEIVGDWVRHNEGWSLSRQGKHVLLERLVPGGPPAVNPAYQNDVASLSGPGAVRYGWICHPHGFVINAKLFLDKMPMDVYKVNVAAGVHVRSAPVSTAVSNAIVKGGDYLVGLDVMHTWLRHSLGWSCISDRDQIFLQKITKKSDMGEIKQDIAVPDAGASSLTTMTVKVSALNVRLSPNSDGAICGKLTQGQKIICLQRQENWVRHELGWSMVHDSKGVTFLDPVPGSAVLPIKPFPKSEAKTATALPAVAVAGPAWECGACTFENKGTALVCEMCAKEKPLLVWRCIACTYENTKFELNAQGQRSCEICSNAVSPPFPPAIAQKPLPSASSSYARSSTPTKVVYASSGSASSSSSASFGKPGDIPLCDVFVVVAAVNVRSRPDLTGTISGVLLRSVMVLSLERQDKWIRHADGWSAVRDQNGVLLEKVNVGELPPASLAGLNASAGVPAIPVAAPVVSSMYPSAVGMAAQPIVYAQPMMQQQQQPPQAARLQFQQPQAYMNSMSMPLPIPIQQQQQPIVGGLTPLQQQQQLLAQYQQQQQQKQQQLQLQQQQMQQQQMQAQQQSLPVATPYVPSNDMNTPALEVLNALPVHNNNVETPSAVASPATPVTRVTPATPTTPATPASPPTASVVATPNPSSSLSVAPAANTNNAIITGDSNVTLELLSVNAPSLNVRSSPSLTAPVVGTIVRGNTVLAQERQGDWVRHTMGWSVARTETGEQCLQSVNVDVYQCVDDKGLRVRSAPSLEAPIVSVVKHGEFLVAQQRQGEWIRHSTGWSKAESQSESGRIVHLNKIKQREEDKNFQCTVPLLNVRSGPNATTPVVAVLREGMPVIILEKQGDWVRHAAGWSLFEDKQSGRVHMHTQAQLREQPQLQHTQQPQQPVVAKPAAVAVTRSTPAQQLQQQPVAIRSQVQQAQLQMQTLQQHQPVAAQSFAAPHQQLQQPHLPPQQQEAAMLALSAQQVKEQQDAMQRIQEAHAKKLADDQSRRHAEISQAVNQRVMEQRRQEDDALAAATAASLAVSASQQPQLQIQQQPQLQTQFQLQNRQLQAQAAQQQQIQQQNMQLQQALAQQQILQQQLLQQQQVTRYQQEQAARGFATPVSTSAFTHTMGMASTTSATAVPAPHQIQMHYPSVSVATSTAPTASFAPIRSTPSSISTPPQPIMATQHLQPSSTGTNSLMVSGTPATVTATSAYPSVQAKSVNHNNQFVGESVVSSISPPAYAPQSHSEIGDKLVSEPVAAVSVATPEAVAQVIDGIPPFVDLAKEQHQTPSESAPVKKEDAPQQQQQPEENSNAFAFISEVPASESEVPAFDPFSVPVSSVPETPVEHSSIEVATKSSVEQPTREIVDVMTHPDVVIPPSASIPLPESAGYTSESHVSVLAPEQHGEISSSEVPISNSEVSLEYDEQDSLQMVEGEASPQSFSRKKKVIILS